MKLLNIDNFVGVFASDQLPQIKNKESFSFIMNTALSNDPGEHWQAIYNDQSSDYIEFFDSYGKKPAKHVGEYLKQFHKKVIYTTNEIQSYNINSVLCGYFSMFYIIMRYKHFHPYDIIYRFGMNNEKSNDEILIRELLEQII